MRKHVGFSHINFFRSCPTNAAVLRPPQPCTRFPCTKDRSTKSHTRSGPTLQTWGAPSMEVWDAMQQHALSIPDYPEVLIFHCCFPTFNLVSQHPVSHTCAPIKNYNIRRRYEVTPVTGTDAAPFRRCPIYPENLGSKRARAKLNSDHGTFRPLGPTPKGGRNAWQRATPSKLRQRWRSCRSTGTSVKGRQRQTSLGDSGFGGAATSQKAPDSKIDEASRQVAYLRVRANVLVKSLDLRFGVTMDPTALASSHLVLVRW